MLALYVLSCGHGDTLLLSMPQGKWALIDCHLPSEATRQRFFRFLTDDLKVRRLDYVVLTHPDFDHYRGMADVLDYFSAEGRTLGYFCGSGHNVKHVMQLQEACGVAEDDVTEYVRLVQTIKRLCDEGKLTLHLLSDQVPEVREAGITDLDGMKFGLFVVAPVWNVLSSATDQYFLDGSVTVEINELSAVLIARLAVDEAVSSFLLAGDAEGECLSQALSIWKKHKDNAEKNLSFDVVKVPHHGSVNGHDKSLCEKIARADVSVAAISCGSAYGLPDRQVLTDYLEEKWQVLCTHTRHPTTMLPANDAGAHPTALQGLHRRTGNPSGITFIGHDLTIRSVPPNPIDAGSAAGSIALEDLPYYRAK